MSANHGLVPPRQRAGDPRHLLLIAQDQRYAGELTRKLADAWPQLDVAWIGRPFDPTERLASERMADADCVMLDIDSPDGQGCARSERSGSSIRIFPSSR